MTPCQEQECNRQSKANGLCRTCIARQKFGDCINDCIAPAASKKGWCTGCYHRGGNPPSRRNSKHDHQATECKKPECVRQPALHKGGLCLTCWQRQKFGDCIHCTQPARSTGGLCTNCVRRGGPPVHSTGVKVNSDLERWCNRCEQVKTPEDFYSRGSNRLAGYCKQCSIEGAVRRKSAGRANLLEWLSERCEQTQRGVCVKCELSLELGGAELDHIVPASLGGSDEVENLQVMCKACNASKGNSESVDYRRWL